MAYAQEAEAALQGPDFIQILHSMYGNQPDTWDTHLTGMERLRCIFNVFTRLRFCTAAGQMEFSASGGLDTAPPGYAPWFSHPRQTESSTVVFGHWSALGLQQHSNFIGLDSACVWGGKLSAVRLSDHRLIQVDCPGHQEVISTCKAAATAPRAINANSRR
jgi:bis(5'-nucleosyl)-tetraphosphatase (symmetrical)